MTKPMHPMVIAYKYNTYTITDGFEFERHRKPHDQIAF